MFGRSVAHLFVFIGREKVRFAYSDHEFFPKRYRGIASAMEEKFMCETIEEKVVKIPAFKGPAPDLSRISKLPMDANFSVFIKEHQQLAVELMQILMDTPIDEFSTTIIYLREHVNPNLFVYASSVVLYHRRNEELIRNMKLPCHAAVFPHMYFDGAAFNQVHREAILDPEHRKPIVIERNHTANDLDTEHHLAYFREDIGFNMHHWHWHLVYPFFGPLEVVKKDRRGEMFYYMHEQIVARYNFERLSNRLTRVRSFTNFYDLVPEGYYPKLTSSVATKTCPHRQPNSKLQDLNREVIPGTPRTKANVFDLELWRTRIMDAIDKGEYLIKDGKSLVSVPWDEKTGTEILGDMIEASILSPNQELYGDLHNKAHLMLACIHDPDHRFREEYSVMGDSATSARDPIFYVLHSFINDIFQKFKATLPPYEPGHPDQLQLEGIKITAVTVKSGTAVPVNEFRTYWQQNDVDVAGGLDYQMKSSLYFRWTHLQHDEFEYVIEVENNSCCCETFTVRIFLAPTYDEGREEFLFEDQRILFIELDRFEQKLTPGCNVISRCSADSSCTIPYEQLFSSAQNNYCQCGWPDYMLIPRGSAHGFDAKLFVMVTADKNPDGQEEYTCVKKAPSYCGLEGKKYPDPKAMGYPFDRPYPKANKLEEFVAVAENMFVQDVVIRFNGDPPRSPE